MGCADCREILSARLDGEQSPDEDAVAEAHLSSCPACREWLDVSASLTRMARTGIAGPAVAVPDSVLDAAPGPGRARLAGGLRIALGLISAVQLGLGMAQVAAAATATGLERGLHAGLNAAHATGASHLWHESAAWNIAVAAGFGWVAARRTPPAGLLPVLSAFVGVLIVLSGGDLLAGRVDTARLVSHGFVLVGFALIVLLTRRGLDFGDPPARPLLPRRPWARWTDGDAGWPTTVQNGQWAARAADPTPVQLRSDRSNAA